MDNEGYRGLVLTKEKGLLKLEARIHEFPSNGGFGKLTYDNLKQKSGLSINTIRGVRYRDGSDYETLYRLFTALGLELKNDDYERRSKETPPSELERNDRIHNLPHPISSFIGRTKEIEDVKSLLGTNRLMTLTGSGGCGKTRLSLQVAEKVLEAFPSGIWLVELAPLVDSSLVPQTVAEVFSIRETPEEPITRTLIHAFKAKQMLLVLDNCEHLRDAAARLVNAILQSCPGVKILVSSRERLGIVGEHTYRVPSLGFPPSAKTYTPESLSRYEAVHLFIERAKAVNTDFTVTLENADTIASVCRRLDGIPLGIELAAAKVRSMSVNEINVGLSKRFDLLKDRSPTALSRHKTLRTAIDWSYEHLSEDERHLLHRLSVFAGGWTEQAAREICAEEGWDSSRVRDLLEELVDKSLIVYAGEPESRFYMLETILHYGAEKLAVNPDEHRFYQKKHLNYFLNWAMTIISKLSGPEQAQLLNMLDTEYPNLDQALLFCVEDIESVEEGLHLGSALQEFWWIRGYLSIGRDRLATLLEKSGAQQRTKARAAALDGKGILARMQGDCVTSCALHRESLDIFLELGEEQEAAYVLSHLGIAVWYLQAEQEALSLFEESLALHRKLKNNEGVAFCLGNLGNMAYESKNYPAAHLWMEECLTMLRQQKNEGGIATCLGNLGNIAFQQEDYVSAFSLLAESLTIQKTVKNKFEIASVLGTVSDLAFKENKWERAARLVGAEERLRTDLGSPKILEAQEKCDRQFAEMLQTWGAERLSKARAEGYSMTLDQAIEYALSKTDTH